MKPGEIGEIAYNRERIFGSIMIHHTITMNIVGKYANKRGDIVSFSYTPSNPNARPTIPAGKYGVTYKRFKPKTGFSKVILEWVEYETAQS